MSRQRFVVDLGAVKLSHSHLQQMEAEIQQATLRVLASTDFRGDLRVRFPREWLGIWIEPGQFDLQLGELEKFAPLQH